MSLMASQITSLTIVYSTSYSGVDQRKHQSSASLAFVWGIPRDRYKGPVTRKMFPFDNVIMGIMNKSDTVIYDSIHKNIPTFVRINQGWYYLANFLRFVSLPICHNNQNNGYMYDATFIFDWCHRIWAAGTPVKYECDWKYLTYQN